MSHFQLIAESSERTCAGLFFLRSWAKIRVQFQKLTTLHIWAGKLQNLTPETQTFDVTWKYVLCECLRASDSIIQAYIISEATICHLTDVSSVTWRINASKLGWRNLALIQNSPLFSFKWKQHVVSIATTWFTKHKTFRSVSKILVCIQQRFRNFQKRGLLFEGYLNFQKFLSGDFCSIWLPSENFQNFQLNGLHSRNLTIFGFSENFPREFTNFLPVFQKNFCSKLMESTQGHLQPLLIKGPVTEHFLGRQQTRK